MTATAWSLSLRRMAAMGGTAAGRDDVCGDIRHYALHAASA
jgi:hypothetical protein